MLRLRCASHAAHGARDVPSFHSNVEYHHTSSEGCHLILLGHGLFGHLLAHVGRGQDILLIHLRCAPLAARGALTDLLQAVRALYLGRFGLQDGLKSPINLMSFARQEQSTTDS